MNRTPIELIPAIIKGSRPSQYEGESFTALEYVSKVAVKINECITEYNEFIKAVADEIETFMNGEVTERDLFERRIEQMFEDFKGVIELKYKAQNATIANAISDMIYGIPENISKALDQMYSNGEFDEIVYNSISNLKAEFDAIVNNTTNFQNAINTSIANMMNSMTAFEGNINSAFETLESELRADIESIIQESSVADMSKATYDNNADGVVNDSDKLGGQLPSYYAKKQELDNLNSMLDTLNNSVGGMSGQIANAQRTASQAKTLASYASDNANTAYEEAKKKLGKLEQAYDSLRLNGKPAGDYATVNSAFNNYSHSKAGNVHYLNGNGENIKFIATADFDKGDTFEVNGVNVSSSLINGNDLTDKFFKAGNVVVCYLNGDKVNFNGGGVGINIEEITVYTGSDFPASPKENDIFINPKSSTAYIYANGMWSEISYEKLSKILYPGATVNNLTEMGGTYSLSEFSVDLTMASTNQNSTLLYTTVDVTDYSTLTVTGHFSSDSATLGFSVLGLIASDIWTPETIKFPFYFRDEYLGQWYTAKRDAWGESFNTHTFDVSTMSGKYYIAIGCYLNSTSVVSCKAKIDCIELS